MQQATERFTGKLGSMWPSASIHYKASEKQVEEAD